LTIAADQARELITGVNAATGMTDVIAGVEWKQLWGNMWAGGAFKRKIRGDRKA
jgi:hypothetical protein